MSPCWDAACLAECVVGRELSAQVLHTDGVNSLRTALATAVVASSPMVRVALAAPTTMDTRDLSRSFFCQKKSRQVMPSTMQRLKANMVKNNEMESINK